MLFAKVIPSARAMVAIWQCPKELISSQIHAVRILMRRFRHAILDQKNES